MTAKESLSFKGGLEVPIPGGQSFEAGAALVKWLADLGAVVQAVGPAEHGVDIHVTLGSAALRRMVQNRRMLMVERNRRWSAKVREGCADTAAQTAEMAARAAEMRSKISGLA